MRTAAAATYYVAPSGADTNPGTAERPFRTLQRAADTVGPGDRVLIRAGIYRESLAVKTSGDAGRPILFEGERGPGGELRSIVDPGVPIAGWVPAPEIGSGVFKTTALDFAPHAMTLNGKQIARIGDHHMQSGAGSLLLNVPDGQTAKGARLAEVGIFPQSSWENVTSSQTPFWDGVEVLYGCLGGATYIRFRGGDDPNGKDLRVSPAGAAISLRDRSHIILRGLAVRGAEIAVEIAGSRAAHNVVEESLLMSKRVRVLITEGASFNLLRNNRMTLGYYGYDSPGVARGYIYRVFKFIVGPGTSDDSGVNIRSAGEGNEVAGNHIHHGLLGVACGQSLRTQVHQNVIHDMASIGIITSENQGYGPVDGEFHDNLVYDCGINLRIHHYNRVKPGQRREYHYRNRFFQREGSDGHHVFVHWLGSEMEPGAEHPEVFLYHNTFVGGVRVIQPNRGMPRTRVLNNILSSATPWYANRQGDADPRTFDLFDFNWVGGAYPFGIPVWFGAHNINAEGQTLWQSTAMPDFALAEDSPARGKGIDLSQPFTVGGKSYDPLPGMKPGYFRGAAPDPGALQYGETAPPPPGCPEGEPGHRR